MKQNKLFITTYLFEVSRIYLKKEGIKPQIL